MRAFVFTDRSLARHAGQFVWLEIDTEKARNAAVRKRLKVQALPTFFVLDPADERVALRWVGGATAPEMVRLLDDGALAVSGKRGPSTSPSLPDETRAAGAMDVRDDSAAVRRARAAGPANAALARADSLYGAGDDAAAARAYDEALALAPEGWPQDARAVGSALFALASAGDDLAAARLARAAFPRLARTSAAANVAASGLDAALSLADSLPGRPDLVVALETDARAVVADTALAIAADDRSSVYISLLDARKDAGDDAGARQVASAWAAFLESQAARAPNPDARAVFDSHRLSACLELGVPERALPMLEASERDLPGDYNPPARLAVALKALRRWDEALAASDRALAKAYGPRQLGILQTRSDIYAGRGDAAAARRTLEDALALAESFPPGQRSEATIAGLKKKLGALK
ncbi:MAG: thioredoxin family protein [Candidatus Eisenbacteria bacterium]|nr:thioredoxin family protein [Candidatus Eisenbacteria bacterium]